MDSEVLLQTHAEVATALAGFAGIVAALGRPLSGLAKQRFFSLLALALIQILGCILPLWLLDVFELPSTGWRFMSALLFVLNAARLWWLVLLPVRRIGSQGFQILGSFLTKATYALGLLGLLILLANAVGIGFEASFVLYYGGLVATLVIGFPLFADVVTRDV